MTVPSAPIPIPPPTGTPAPPEQCTLDPLDGPERMRRWQRLADTARPQAQWSRGVLVVRYQPLTGVLDELSALAAAEADCCSFADWQVTAEQAIPTLQITATSDPDAIVGIAALFGAETTDDRTTS